MDFKAEKFFRKHACGNHIYLGNPLPINSDWLVFLTYLTKLATNLIVLGETLLSDPREFLHASFLFHINGQFIVRDVKPVSLAVFSILTATHLGSL